MGNKASKQMNDDMNVNKPEDINKIKLPNLLHIIAAKFIIQSTFQDLENLQKYGSRTVRSSVRSSSTIFWKRHVSWIKVRVRETITFFIF